jgi:hypothetical protein
MKDIFGILVLILVLLVAVLRMIGYKMSNSSEKVIAIDVLDTALTKAAKNINNPVNAKRTLIILYAIAVLIILLAIGLLFFHDLAAVLEKVKTEAGF